MEAACETQARLGLDVEACNLGMYQADDAPLALFALFLRVTFKNLEEAGWFAL